MLEAPASYGARNTWESPRAKAELEEERRSPSERKIEKEKRRKKKGLQERREEIKKKQARGPEWYEDWACEITREDKQRRSDPMWFTEQMNKMMEMCRFCQASDHEGKSKCWKHNWQCCRFCNMGQGYCERHDQHGRWKPDMCEIMSGRWERRIAREASIERDRQEGEEYAEAAEDAWEWQRA